MGKGRRRAGPRVKYVQPGYRHRAPAAPLPLTECAVALGIGWPDIAARLGVTRQAARQHYQRRHRGEDAGQDHAA
jgi:hypothetical protein